MDTSQQIQGAIQDLNVIRRTMERASEGTGPIPRNRFAIDGHLLFQGICLLICVGMILAELLTGHVSSLAMLASAESPALGVLEITNVGVGAALLAMCIYFIAWRAARHNDESFHSYVGRNFQYLRNLSFVSDLLVKFAAVSLLILGAHPEWIPALLTLFVADYLIQGRYFTLPIRLAMGFGIAAFAAAVAQFALHSTLLIYPLSVFLVAQAFSIAILVRSRIQSQ